MLSKKHLRCWVTDPCDLCLISYFFDMGGNYRRPYGNSKCLQSKETSTTPFRGCRSRRRRLVSLEKISMSIKFSNSLGPDQAWQNARHILSSLVRFLTVCYFQVLLFYYLSAQECKSKGKYPVHWVETTAGPTETASVYSLKKPQPPPSGVVEAAEGGWCL